MAKNKLSGSGGIMRIEIWDGAVSLLNGNGIDDSSLLGTEKDE